MAVKQAQWTSSLRRAQHAMIALVLWNGLATATLAMYGLKEGSCDWLATLQLVPGRLTRVSIWMKGADTYAAYGPGTSESAPAASVVLVDLWDHNTTQRTLVHVAGITLSQHDLLWLAGGATVAPLGPFILLAWHRRQGQHDNGRQGPVARRQRRRVSPDNRQPHVSRS